PSCGR
ncbi:pyridine nucleotide-disulfide oxidoreductase family protein, partial [Vibrio parahaemolyticus AQ3810]